MQSLPDDGVNQGLLERQHQQSHRDGDRDLPEVDGPGHVPDTEGLSRLRSRERQRAEASKVAASTVATVPPAKAALASPRRSSGSMTVSRADSAEPKTLAPAP